MRYVVDHIIWWKTPRTDLARFRAGKPARATLRAPGMARSARTGTETALHSLASVEETSDALQEARGGRGEPEEGGEGGMGTRRPVGQCCK